jgi:hypothetical protein
MKARLNLTIDTALLEEIKAYANRKQTSVSELVEYYFKSVTMRGKRKNILDLIERMEKPAIDPSADLKELYYTEQSGKYGF